MLHTVLPSSFPFSHILLISRTTLGVSDHVVVGKSLQSLGFRWISHPIVIHFPEALYHNPKNLRNLQSSQPTVSPISHPQRNIMVNDFMFVTTRLLYHSSSLFVHVAWFGIKCKFNCYVITNVVDIFMLKCQRFLN